MTLLLVILGCVAAVIVFALLARREVLPPALLTFLTIVAPLGAFLYTQTRAQPTHSSVSLSILGQYHRLTDTLLLSADDTADLVLRRLTDSRVQLAYAPGANQLSVSVLNGAAPVMLDDQPVNAIKLDRRTVVRTTESDQAAIHRPWWCWYRCNTRYIDVSTGDEGFDRTETDLARPLQLVLGSDTVIVFRSGTDAFVAADPRKRVRVSQVEIPATLVATGDTLRIGAVSIAVTPRLAEHRIELRFGDPDDVGRWDLSQGNQSFERFLISSTLAFEVPGTMPVLNPAKFAPGAARTGYGGVLERNPGWSFHANGGTRALQEGSDELLPGGDAIAGHIVRIGRSETDPGSTRNAVIIVWLLAAALLAWNWRHVFGAGLLWRLSIAGMVFTLVAVRGMLAFRTWLARPFDAQPAITFLALLVALPATIALYHIWDDIAANARREPLHRRRLIALLAPSLAFIAIGLITLLLLTGASWRFAIARTALTPIGLGVLGMAMLQRLLVPPLQRRDDLHGPLAALHPAGAQASMRHFLTGVAVLCALGLMLFGVAMLVTAGKALALIGLALVGVVLLLGVAGRPAIVQPRRGNLRYALVVGVTLIGALAGYVLAGGFVLPILGAAVAGWVGWHVAHRHYPRLRPMHLRDLLPPWFLLVSFVTAALVIVFGLMSRLRVTVEYALSLAGLIVIARIFAVLWFRQSERAALAARRITQSSTQVRISAVFLVLALSAAVYLPLGATDPGLVLLFFSAATIAACIGLASVGRRGALVGLLVLGGLVATFFAGMWVRPATLQQGTAGLSTAEIRYAAAYHPDELQRHMLLVDDGSPLTTIRTLQQYWGMQHYAAIGGLNGRGYFQAEFTSQGITRPVALTENVFSVFVLSEHGWLGGAALLLGYLLLGLALFGAALYCCRSREYVPHALLLGGVATYWLVPALYMAAANGSIVPLTGQNVPMLGLLSAADVALVTWLSALGLVAVPGARAAGVEYIAGDRVRRVRAAIKIAAAGFTAATIAIIALLWKPTHQPTRDFRLDVVTAEAEALIDNRMLFASSDTIAVVPNAQGYATLAPGRFLTRALQSSNVIARGGSAGARCYEADPLLRVSGSEVMVGAAICGQRATVERAYPWQGLLRGANGRTDYVLSDGGSAVVLTPEAETDLAALGKGCAVAGLVHARAVRIGCAENSPVARPGRTALAFATPAGSRVLINGVAPGAMTLLNAGDHIAMPGQADVMASEVPAGSMAYPRWENGGWRRLASAAGPTWLVQLDSQLTRSMSTRTRERADVVVTIDVELQDALRTAVEQACAAIPNARTCSALLADPNTGAIRALADASSTRNPPRHRPGDYNLRNHPGASAIKPIIAAAALNAYPRLQGLEVDHSAAQYTVIANEPIRAPFRAGRLYPNARVGWNGFLPASDNVYAATLGFLAAAPAGRDGLPARRGNDNSSRNTVNGAPLTGRPAWQTARGKLRLENSPLARELERLFAVSAAGVSDAPHDKRFFADAVKLGVLQDVADLQRVSPEAITLRLDSIDSARDLASFMIGGGTNRWSNLGMVQALSELYSGRDVQLHVLSAAGSDSLKQSFGASQIKSEARTAVLDGMRGVIREPYATAASLRSVFPGNVRWLGKTGTLQEEWIGSIFMFAGTAQHPKQQSCAAAGIVTLEFGPGGDPDGQATAFFRTAIAPLLSRHLGWSDRPCEN